MIRATFIHRGCSSSGQDPISKEILHPFGEINTIMCHDAFCIVSGYYSKNNKLFLNT